MKAAFWCGGKGGDVGMVVSDLTVSAVSTEFRCFGFFVSIHKFMLIHCINK